MSRDKADNDKPTPVSARSVDTSAVGNIDEAIANVRANTSKDGLTPQQERAIQKLRTARALLTGTQTRLR